MKKHQIRIVGGLYKRTPITVINGEQLRPTSDRTRETLFNWLNHFWGTKFDDKNVLDLFAGSGALGLEAASRGVAKVQIIDNSPAAIKQIKTTITKLNAPNIQAQRADAISFLSSQHQPGYDLVLLDPPFGHDWCNQVIPLLEKVLYSDGLIYLETETGFNSPLLSKFQVLRENSSKNVKYRLLQFAAMQKSSNNDNKF